MASLTNRQYGLIDNWLRHLRDLAHGHREQLEAMEEGPLRADLMCELSKLVGVNVGTLLGSRVCYYTNFTLLLTTFCSPLFKNS